MRYFDLHQKVSTYAKSVGNDGPDIVVRRTSSTSEPASEFEDNGCQANYPHMPLRSKITPLRHTPCGDTDCDIVPILREDPGVSKLPQVMMCEGVKLRSIRRDMYTALRANQAGSVLQCMRLGVSVPEGKNY